MLNKSFWLYIEPYAQIFIKPDYVLVYNTLSGKHIESKKDTQTYKLLSKLALKKNLYIIKLSKYDILKKEISEFIDLLRECFIGDILDSSWSDKKPVQMIPVQKIENTIEGDEVN